jgi:WD domain, G-beta repeat
MRWSLWLLASLAVLLSAGVASAGEAGPSREETLTLQKRLTDAGCYQGAIDGAPSAALDAAVKACPDQAPYLRIEAGMHIAPIRAISLSADQKLAATGSDDKTVRLWSIPDGRLQRTLRMPIDSGNGGKINAVALSPDSTIVAAGGWDAASSVEGKHYVTLFDLRAPFCAAWGLCPMS